MSEISRFNKQEMAHIMKDVQKNAPPKTAEEKSARKKRIAESERMEKKWGPQGKENYYAAKSEGHAKRHREWGRSTPSRHEHPTPSGWRER